MSEIRQSDCVSDKLRPIWSEICLFFNSRSDDGNKFGDNRTDVSMVLSIALSYIKHIIV